MRPYKILVRNVNLTAAGVTIPLPKGTQRLLAVTIRGGNSAAANANAPANVGTIFTRCRHNYGGQIVRDVDVTRLCATYTAMSAAYSPVGYAGAVNGAGRIEFTYFCAEPWREYVSHRDALGFQTGFLSQTHVHQLELDFAAGITGACEAILIVDDVADAKGPHAIIAIEEVQKAATALALEVPEVSDDNPYSLLSFFDTSDAKTVEQVQLRNGKTFPHDLPKNVNSSYHKQFANMNPAAGAYHIAGDVDDNLDNVVPSKSLEATVTFSAAPGGGAQFWLVAQRLMVPNIQV